MSHSEQGRAEKLGAETDVAEGSDATGEPAKVSGVALSAGFLPASADAQKVLSKRAKMMRRKFWQHPLALLGMVLIAIWLIVAITAPWIAPFDPVAQGSGRFMPPSADNLMGTDGLGRDILSRVIYGSRITLPYAILLVVLSAAIGCTIGAISGYVGGLVDELLMRLADMFFAFPTIILALAVAAALGPGLNNAVVAIAFVAWPVYARVTRSFVLSARSEDYVSAARLLGSSTRRTLVVDIVPNMAGPLAVLAMLELGNAVLLLSALSFLGLGAQPPAAEWGVMVAGGVAVMDRWWVGSFAGIAILSVVLAFNLLGDTLRDAVDPRVAKHMKTEKA